MTDTQTPAAARATDADLVALGGVDGSPTIFTVLFQGHTWEARQISDGIALSRTCRGCWAQPAGMWNPRKHRVEAWLDTDEAAGRLTVVKVVKRHDQW